MPVPLLFAVMSHCLVMHPIFIHEYHAATINSATFNMLAILKRKIHTQSAIQIMSSKELLIFYANPSHSELSLELNENKQNGFRSSSNNIPFSSSSSRYFPTAIHNSSNQLKSKVADPPECSSHQHTQAYLQHTRTVVYQPDNMYLIQFNYDGLRSHELSRYERIP